MIFVPFYIFTLSLFPFPVFYINEFMIVLNLVWFESLVKPMFLMDVFSKRGRVDEPHGRVVFKHAYVLDDMSLCVDQSYLFWQI